MIYFGGLVLGLLLPFKVIYTDDLLDTKIKKPFGYRGKTIIPFIGDLPTSDFPLKLLNQRVKLVLQKHCGLSEQTWSSC
jgi:hypothetical protein